MSVAPSHASGTPSAWDLVWGQPYIDGQALAAAIGRDLLAHPAPDFRTRLLARDAMQALEDFWGAARFTSWLSSSPASPQLRAVLSEELGDVGFPSIRRRLVTSVGEREVRQVFDLLGRGIHSFLEVYVAGSIPTLLAGLTVRPTADIDLVDEVPEAIRQQRAILRRIEDELGLVLGHVQSHYLPANWQRRRHFFGEFSELHVYLVDVYDVFVSKLSSRKKKHQEDLRVLASRLDRETAHIRLIGDGRLFLDDPKLRPQIEENWRFIFQEPLVVRQAETRPTKKRGRKKKQ